MPALPPCNLVDEIYEITTCWNGQVTYPGGFNGVVGVRPDADAYRFFIRYA